MNRLPVWAQWALVPVLTVLLPILGNLAPQMIPVVILIIPIALLIGFDSNPRKPPWHWRKDRA